MKSSIHQIVLRKTVFGMDFATCTPGWIGNDERNVGPERRGYQFLLRQFTFNERSGLPTYLCRVVFEDGSSDSTFVHSIRAAVEYFESFVYNSEVVVEGNRV
jgi:hypothetical protein